MTRARCASHRAQSLEVENTDFRADGIMMALAPHDVLLDGAPYKPPNLGFVPSTLNPVLNLVSQVGGFLLSFLQPPQPIRWRIHPWFRPRTCLFYPVRLGSPWLELIARAEFGWSFLDRHRRLRSLWPKITLHCTTEFDTVHRPEKRSSPCP